MSSVLALKRSTDVDSANAAFSFLDKLTKSVSHDAITNDQRIEIRLTMGIGAVLLDDPAAARVEFERVLKLDKGNETARQALAMLAGR